MLGSAEKEHLGLLKNSNLCDHDTSTSRTDGRATCPMGDIAYKRYRLKLAVSVRA